MDCTVELQRTVLTDAVSFLQLCTSPRQPESPRAEGSWGSKAQKGLWPGQLVGEGSWRGLPDPHLEGRKEKPGWERYAPP